MAARGTIHTQQLNLDNYAEGAIRSTDGLHSTGTLSSGS